MKYTIKQWRGIRGLSQKDLAKAIGKTDMTISLWETGKTEPAWSDLVKISQALNTGGIDNIVMPEH